MTAPDNSQATRVSWRELAKSGVLLPFVLLAMGIWLHAADELVIATIMTDMVRDIGGLNKIAWNLALYEMGSVLAGAAMGLQVSRRGLRQPYVAAATLYIGGCCVSAIAPIMDVMLAGRLLQGLGAGGLVAIAFIAVERLFDRAIWPQLFALLSAIWGGSAFAGPLIGGAFAQFGWWRGAFWCFAAQAVLLTIAVLFFVPEADRPAPKQSKESGTFPALRLAILAASILTIASAGTADTPTLAVVFIVLGLSGLAFTVYIDQKHAKNPILPRSVMQPGSLARSGLILVFTLSAGTISFSIFAPILLRELHHISAFNAGYIIALESIGWSAAAILFANQPPASEPRLILTGSFLAIVAVPGFALAMPGGPVWAVAALALIQGAGFGLFWAFLIGRMVDAVPEHEKPIASAAIPLVQRIAYATGAAGAGIAANLAGFSHGLSTPHAQSVAVWIFIAFIPLLLVAAAAAIKVSRR